MGRAGLEGGPPGEALLGPHAVREALRAGRRRLRRIFLARDARDPRVSDVVARAARQGIPVEQAPRGRLTALAGTDRHQGLVALADPFAYEEAEDLAARATARSEFPLLVVLDGIEDPHNLGAVLRSAEALGADGVILPKHRTAGITATVLRVASGAAEHLPVARATNLAACLTKLKALGYWVCGAAVQSGDPPERVDLRRPLVLVIGGEHGGIRRGIREQCDLMVSIPLAGQVGSLNASVAAGILLYEARRQRGFARVGEGPSKAP